ncbi:hypothetical protein AMK59_335, partial [Oryctes borbonicus]
QIITKMTETVEEEQVVMTPKCKTANSTTLIIERKIVKKANDKMHVAGGEHTGIVINKESLSDNDVSQAADLVLEFRVFLVSAQTGKHTQESRTLRFWFREKAMQNGHINNHSSGDEQAAVAQDFFRELVSPQEFPRDYVGFIKKIMKLMQRDYFTINKLEIELKQLEEAAVPNRPPRPGYLHIQLSPSLCPQGLVFFKCWVVVARFENKTISNSYLLIIATFRKVVTNIISIKR